MLGGGGGGRVGGLSVARLLRRGRWLVVVRVAVASDDGPDRVARGLVAVGGLTRGLAALSRWGHERCQCWLMLLRRRRQKLLRWRRRVVLRAALGGRRRELLLRGRRRKLLLRGGRRKLLGWGRELLLARRQRKLLLAGRRCKLLLAGRRRILLLAGRRRKLLLAGRRRILLLAGRSRKLLAVALRMRVCRVLLLWAGDLGMLARRVLRLMRRRRALVREAEALVDLVLLVELVKELLHCSGGGVVDGKELAMSRCGWWRLRGT